MSQSSLTPGFSSFTVSSDNEAKRMRQAAEGMIIKGNIESAIVLLQEVLSSGSSTIDDYQLLARAYFLSGENKRCLVVLEQQDMLSLTEIQLILNWIDDKSARSKGVSNILTDSEVTKRLFNFQLAGRCLLKQEKYDDCIGLLDSFRTVEDIAMNESFHPLFRLVDDVSHTNPLAAIFCIIGKCLDMLENRVDSVRLLTLALQVDLSCVEALDYLVNKKLISSKEKENLFQQLPKLNGRLAYLEPLYRKHLLNEDHIKNVSAMSVNSSYAIIAQAEYFYNNYCSEEAYKLARKAYYLDPSDQRGLIVYIAAAFDLSLLSELYYLGHELTTSSPKLAISWYAVGCYYFCCKKFELAQKYLTKATKLDKRCLYCWIALGHTLGAQQESEHAVSSYRTAARLAPGDYTPMLFISRELVRMNNFPMALHFLLNASQKDARDPQILNEIGVILLKMGRIEESVRYFDEAVCRIQINAESSSAWLPRTRGCAVEILCNHGVALRKLGDDSKAEQCYLAAISLNPQDPDVHSSLGFLYHITRRFDKALAHYHSTLAIRPNNPLVLDLLQKALIDTETFESTDHKCAR